VGAKLMILCCMCSTFCSTFDYCHANGFAVSIFMSVFLKQWPPICLHSHCNFCVWLNGQTLWLPPLLKHGTQHREHCGYQQLKCS